MLTQQDLKAIGQLIDKKVGNDIAAIQTRLANFESKAITSLDFLRLLNKITGVETRMAAMEHKISLTATKEDLNKFVSNKTFHKAINDLTKLIQIGFNLERGTSVRLNGHDKTINGHERRLDRVEDKVFV